MDADRLMTDVGGFDEQHVRTWLAFRLDDTITVVTGASSGLGVAYAQGPAEVGADVALGVRRVERLTDTATLSTQRQCALPRQRHDLKVKRPTKTGSAQLRSLTSGWDQRPCSDPGRRETIV